MSFCILFSEQGQCLAQVLNTIFVQRASSINAMTVRGMERNRQVQNLSRKRPRITTLDAVILEDYMVELQSQVELTCLRTFSGSVLLPSPTEPIFHG